ncbi:hypothetical protein D3C78_1344050 [compost metagenome]
MHLLNEAICSKLQGNVLPDPTDSRIPATLLTDRYFSVILRIKHSNRKSVHFSPIDNFRYVEFKRSKSAFMLSNVYSVQPYSCLKIYCTETKIYVFISRNFQVSKFLLIPPCPTVLYIILFSLPYMRNHNLLTIF